MSFLPATCERCATVTLAVEDELVPGAAECVACGGAADVLPGCSYTVAEVTLFTELCMVIDAAHLSPLEARRLADFLEGVVSVDMGRHAFADVVRRLPSLAAMQVVFEVWPDRRLQALRMLATILSARERFRPSGIAAVEPSPGSGQRPAGDEWSAEVAEPFVLPESLGKST